jgi:hypothetical protein
MIATEDRVPRTGRGRRLPSPAGLNRIALTRLSERQLPPSEWSRTLLEVYREVVDVAMGETAEAGPDLNAPEVAERLGCSLRRAHEVIREIRAEPPPPPRRVTCTEEELAAYLVGRWQRMRRRRGLQQIDSTDP